MKKITLLLFTLLISVFGFSQNLVTNGNFQTGTAAPWTGNAANVVDLGASNFVNQANVAVAGNPWDVNLSQEVNLVDGKTYLLKFDAFTATATGTRTLISGLGQTGAPFASLTATSVLTATPQTFSYEFTINYGNTVTDRVIFDMGNATGFVFIDNILHSISSLFFSNKSIALGFPDKYPHIILSSFSFNKSIALGFIDRLNQSILFRNLL